MSDGQVKDKLITAQSLKYVYDKLDEDMSELQTYSMSLANNQITLTGSNGSTSSVTLPTASADTLGGIKVGENLSINNGVLSASGGTYESKAAVSGGTDVSLVTTGQKYIWNTKMNNYGTCSTAANVAAKTVSLSGFVLTTGSVVNVRFDNSNTASNPTLNVNDTGACAIMKYGSTASGVTAASSWNAGSVITLVYDGTYWVMADFNATGMYIASYGNSTYAEVLEAYQDNKIIYCRASSNSNPATDNQLRMAFLAYINDQVTPTNFEFQYYRSVNTLSITQQGDQVYVYKLDKTSGWSVTIRQAYSKIANGTGLSESYNSSTRTLTLNHSNSVTAQTTQAIYPIKIDAQGHINSYGSAVTPLTADSTLDATKLSGAVPRASLPSNYCTCNTVAGTAAKTASLTGFILSTGSIVHVRFTYTNSTSSPSLNINSTGAYYIKRYGTTANMSSSANSWYAGAVVTFIFDGSYWMMVDYQPPLSMGSGLYISNSTIYHDSSVNSQSTQAVYPITINSSGHITGYGSAQTILTASDVNDLIETYLSDNYGNGDEDTYGNGTSN